MQAARRDTFHDQGILLLPDLYSERQVAGLRARGAELLGPGGRLPAPRLPSSHLMWAAADTPRAHVRVALHLCHLDARFRRHALAPQVRAAVERIFREPAVVLTSLLFNKPAAIGLEVSAHQDLPYYPYLGDQDLVTCWTALDEVTSENGGLEYFPGTHTQRHPHVPGENQHLEVELSLLEGSRSLRVDLSPGDGVLHHGLTVHRSGPNTSGSERRGVAVLYTRASVRVTEADFVYGTLVADGAGASE